MTNMYQEPRTYTGFSHKSPASASSRAPTVRTHMHTHTHTHTHTHIPTPASSCCVHSECRPSEPSGLGWWVTPEGVRKEMERQQADVVDISFCLRWHAHSPSDVIPKHTHTHTLQETHTHTQSADGNLAVQLPAAAGMTLPPTPPPVSTYDDPLCVAVLSHLHALELLGYFGACGEVTVFGQTVALAAQGHQGVMLLLLELLRLGAVSGDYLDAPDRNFRSQGTVAESGKITRPTAQMGGASPPTSGKTCLGDQQTHTHTHTHTRQEQILGW
eukprot:GHVR01023389.1.p1 GENE.GHVR01023389.1~~GHVR01023389.1.p1  ORF type:complete len:272 (-),score=129.95 GHVR01023389.1:98-913(-)